MDVRSMISQGMERELYVVTHAGMTRWREGTGTLGASSLGPAIATVLMGVRVGLRGKGMLAVTLINMRERMETRGMISYGMGLAGGAVRGMYVVAGGMLRLDWGGIGR